MATQICVASCKTPMAFARLAIEPRLAVLAALRLTPPAIDRLEAIDAAVNRAIEAGRLPDYLAANHAFHFALYEAAEAPVLLDLARSLWLRFGPSLRVVVAREGALALPDLHVEALAAVERGDAAGLAAKLREQGVIVRHFKQARIAQFLRISIGTPEQNQALLDALAVCLA